MNPAAKIVLTVNGGSSSIKFALFEADRMLPRILTGQIAGIGLSQGTFSVKGADAADNFSRQVAAADHTTAKKWICALAGALDGLDSLVSAGGIGENSPQVRSRICAGLDWIGVRLNEDRNRANAPVISREGGPVTVRVIRTDEEQIIARSVYQLLDLETDN